MKKTRFTLLILILIITSFFSCKLSEEILLDFNILETSGYSKAIFEDYKMKDGSSNLNFFVAIKSLSDKDATITKWTFKIMHSIVPLVEITNSNLEKYKLELSGSTSIPANHIKELYINTKKPFKDNLIENKELGFEDYIPTGLVVELEITDSEGKVTTISGKGEYVYETEIDDEDK